RGLFAARRAARGVTRCRAPSSPSRPWTLGPAPAARSRALGAASPRS
ncbi:hypothetical protein CFC21_069573, partial [Triticum aestivum]